MKKVISLFSAIALILSVTGCDKAPKDRFEGLKLLNAWAKKDVDRIAYYDLDTLEEESDLAVVGTVVGEPRQEEHYDDSIGMRIRTNIVTTHTIEISKVLKGDVNVGDKIDVYQRYGIVNDSLVILDGCTPMSEGDEWLFYLKKQPDMELYYYSGVIDGRYPTPNTKSNCPFSLSDYPELGVFDEKDFNQRIYDELLEKYDFLHSDENT